MVKRGNRRKARGGYSKSGSSVLETGTAVIPILSTAVSSNVSLNPSNTVFSATRLGALSDLYTEYCWESCVVEWGSQTAASARSAVGYVSATLGALPAWTVSQIGDLTPMVQRFASITTPSKLFLGRKTLVGQAAQKFYKVGLGTDADTQGEVQGYLAVATDGAAGTIYATIHYKIKFAGRIDPTVNPSYARRVVERLNDAETMHCFKLLLKKLSLNDSQSLLLQSLLVTTQAPLQCGGVVGV